MLLFFIYLPQICYSKFSLTPEVQNSYHEILKLKSNSAYLYLEKVQSQDPENSLFLLVENYRDILRILTEENQTVYQEFKPRENERINAIRKDKENSPWKKLAEAEIRFQWALAKMKFGDELAAAWAFRQVYDLLKDNQKQYPDFIHQKKLLGLYQIFIGSVPEKYDWVKNTLGFKGKVSTGITLLKEVEKSGSFYSLEAFMLRVAAEKYIIKQNNGQANELEKKYKAHSDHLLYTFLYASVNLKEGHSDKAFDLLDKFNYRSGYLSFPLNYLIKGEILLYRESYWQARDYFEKYLYYTKGKDHIKDASYKIFLTYWLSNDEENARIWLEKIRENGQAVYDADKYADKFARTSQMPDKALMKARLSTDGGYYETALQQLSKFCFKKIPDDKDNIEFWYRKGRILQLKGERNLAKDSFKKAVNLSQNKNYYFAPNACLQLGYIFQEEKDYGNAKYFFQKALSFKDHEYKNSIDNKAKAALNELP